LATMAGRLALAIAVVAALPSLSLAQTPDFLFGRPDGAIGVRSGWNFARADSDLFEFVEEHLTLERKDFNAPALGVDVDVAINSRTSAVIGFDFNRSSRDSEYRRFVDNRRLPITQTTSLREMNLSGGVKFALTPRGREISRNAWIPAAVTPYVGAGAGALHYKFLQTGDFIDVDDPSLAVFGDTFRSSGWTPSAHIFGGVDVKVWRKVYAGAEARYLWSHATLDGDFIDFDPIDLAGFNVTGGVRFMF
jgi:opacity protein-like surface antigen